MIRTVQRELVIVGGGIEGRITALLAWERGFRDIVLYDAPDAKGLGPDSLRNHAWLQSGLLYVGTNLVSARKMYSSGLALHEKVRIPIPKRRGIFGIPRDDKSRDIFRARVQSIKLKGVEPLSTSQAARALGAFFKKSLAYYYVPDTPFDEAAVMRSAQDIGENEYGVKFRMSRVDLVPNKASSAGFFIKTDQEVIEPHCTILCAGSGTIKLLDQLSIEHPLAVYRSPLLRIRTSGVMEPPLLVEVEMTPECPASGLSVAQHDAHVIPPKGCLVIGGRGRRRLDKDSISDRWVTLREESEIRSSLPPELLPAQRAPDVRVIAGHKTEAVIGGKSSIDPWIGFNQWKHRYSGLVAIVPGKATMAFSAATRGIRLLKPKPQLRGSRAQALLDHRLGNASEEHFRESFDGKIDELDKDDIDEDGPIEDRDDGFEQAS